MRRIISMAALLALCVVPRGFSQARRDSSVITKPPGLALVAVTNGELQTVLFQDDFRARLGAGWSWVREDPQAWRVTPRGLEIRLQPGNMWGPANNARNVLVHPAPDPAQGEVEVSVTLTNQPSGQYEQVDLVWYYDDSHMVKIGQEQVDGKLSLVMGREAADQCRTIVIIPIEAHALQVRFLVSSNSLQGQFRPVGTGTWQDAGTCTLPVHGAPKVSLQAYQGPPGVERWARFSDFRIAVRRR